MYQLPNIVKEELDFFKTKNFIKINIFNEIKYNIQLIKEELKDKDKLIIVSQAESFGDMKLYDSILEVIDDNPNKDIRISCATASKFPFSTHPLTNLIMWKDVVGRNDVMWICENAPTFPNFTKDEIISCEHKNLKSILSVRKENELRKYLFDNIHPTDVDGICRFYRWRNGVEEEDTKSWKTQKIRTIGELHGDYKQSFVSFVVETELGDSSQNFTSTFTEKTLFSIVNGTMPIILGSKNLLNDLKSIGIKTFNEEFGFGDVADFYDSHSTKRIDKFIECIHNVKNTDISDIKKMWIARQPSIQKNYDIIASILFNDEFSNYFYSQKEISARLSNTFLNKFV